MLVRRTAVLGAVVVAAVLAGVDVGSSSAAAGGARTEPTIVLAAGTAAKGRTSGGLTPTERKAIDIVSVTAAGAAEAGLTVTVTFAGNVERTLGRGNLKNAVVGLILRPAGTGLANAYLATLGAGGLGRTLRQTSSPDVGVVRDGRRLTFFISGPGAENVAAVTVKAFARFRPPGKRQAQSRSVDPAWWEELEGAIAAEEATLDDPLNAAEGETTCEGLQELQRRVDAMLARARAREESIKDLKRRLERAIPELEADLRSQQWRHASATLLAIGTSFATPLAILGGGPGAAGLLAHAGALKTIQNARQAKEELRDAIRSLKLDVRLADAFVDRNRKLIEKILLFKGRVDALLAQRCATVEVSSTWTHNPPLGKSNTCVDVVARETLGAQQPLKGTFTVQLTGPSISAGTGSKRPLEDGRGRFIGTITKAGTHTAQIEVFDESGTRVAQLTHTFVIAEPPQDGPQAAPPCPKPTG